MIFVNPAPFGCLIYKRIAYIIQVATTNPKHIPNVVRI